MTAVIGHRGAPQRARENTLESFRAAVGVGVAGIELDARRTVDEVLVVHHDARLADGRAIVGCTHAELPGYIPSLAAALDACAGAFVNIEIKNQPGEPDFDPNDAVVDAVIALLHERPEPASTWLISSFRWETVDRCHALDAGIPTAWLTVNVITDDDIVAVANAGHAALHPWLPTVDQVLIDACHEAGLGVNTWTCNDPELAVRLASWGIDGICTDVPDVLVAAFA
jgi:glycerophosphoryl diester phosphodiesterase